jgi:hypothetical protein
LSYPNRHRRWPPAILENYRQFQPTWKPP